MNRKSERTVITEGQEIHYYLERKNVKNLNLRVRKDGSVYVSANESVPCEELDDFVCSKASYIIRAVEKFKEMTQYKPQPK